MYGRIRQKIKGFNLILKMLKNGDSPPMNNGIQW